MHLGIADQARIVVPGTTRKRGRRRRNGSSQLSGISVIPAAAAIESAVLSLISINVAIRALRYSSPARHREMIEGIRNMPQSQSPTWPMFHRVWRRAELFERMAAMLGIDMLNAARIDRGEAISEARGQCLRCTNASDCRNRLDASEGLPIPPRFCPNADFFHRCLHDNGGCAGR